PTGKPIITSAHNTSATSIYLAWKAPSPDTIHGEFLGYRIGYKPRDKPYMEEKEVYIRNPAIDNHTIRNLQTYTQYLVSLQVFNPEGHGPATTISVMTDEGGEITNSLQYSLLIVKCIYQRVTKLSLTFASFLIWRISVEPTDKTEHLVVSLYLRSIHTSKIPTLAELGDEDSCNSVLLSTIVIEGI
ncbi:unnamed protein product, partial [Heterotrigona itama]